jgi:predicted amidohydrolase YtcJ
MAVLSDDILSVASTKIREIKIDQTYVDGRLVFDRSN